MSEIESYLFEINNNLDKITNRPVDQQGENLIKLKNSIIKLTKKFKELQKEDSLQLTQIFDKYAQYVRDCKEEFHKYGISKPGLVLRMEYYFMCKKRGKLSIIRDLYKEIHKIEYVHYHPKDKKFRGLAQIQPEGKPWEKLTHNRKMRRQILFENIPQHKKFRKDLKDFSKEEIKKFYVIRYLDDLLTLMTDWHLIAKLTDKISIDTSTTDKQDRYFSDFFEIFKLQYMNDIYNGHYEKAEKILENILYNLKYLYKIEKDI